VYRQYEWFLDRNTDWNNYLGGDGRIDGGYFSIDSIRFTGLADATFTLDDVVYNAAAVIPVPEPGTALTILFVGVACARRSLAPRSASLTHGERLTHRTPNGRRPRVTRNRHP
jgi:hypothetical protein